MLGDKSFAYDLVVERGVVRGRVALLLRSAETKPLIPDLFNEPLPVKARGGEGAPPGLERDWFVEACPSGWTAVATSVARLGGVSRRR
jgi:hypothetical protein